MNTEMEMTEKIPKVDLPKVDVPKLSGNDAYQTNFKKVKFGDLIGNGLVYSKDRFLWVRCPKSSVYVSGAIYHKVENNWALVQVDMVTDDKETEQVENTIRFEMFNFKGQWFSEGEYMLKVVADGTQKWKDEFIIGSEEAK